MRLPGCFSYGGDGIIPYASRLQVVSLHLKSWASVCPLHSLQVTIKTNILASFAFSFVLPCGRAKQAAEPARGAGRLVLYSKEISDTCEASG